MSERAESVEDRTTAYLIVSDGRHNREVYKLTADEKTTVGRAADNRVVVRDDRCSRYHCSVFWREQRWWVRDLDSRNGTFVNGVRVEGETELKEGDLIRVGGYHMVLTFDLSRPVEALDDVELLEPGHQETVEVPLTPVGEESAPAIVHRKRRTRFDRITPKDVVGREQTGQQLARLYRLALDMAAARDSSSLSQLVLDRLLEATGADIGAILLLKEQLQEGAEVGELEVVAYRSRTGKPYERVSTSLSRLVLTEWEAVLAHDVHDDTWLAGRDSLSELRVRSVICAPIRAEKTIYGLIHLYSTDSSRPLGPDDLEFTLAVADQMALALKNIKQMETLATGLARVQDEYYKLWSQVSESSEIIGESPSIRRLREAIARIAPTDATVLIRGESGVGKELVARAIHFNSPRRNRPFVCMNCAALSETLLESELFGHEKGAFTGATERKLGKFEQADGGTLFLDEVGELSPSIQAKFLRVLEGHPFERVGGSQPIQVDVRVVAATNRDLAKAVEQKQFRQDLFFRLYVVEIYVEPLRKRRSDIPILAHYFLSRAAQRLKIPVKGFTPEALEILQKYDWPGNVRELQNCIERAVILCSGGLITPKDLRLSSLPAETDWGEEPAQAGVELLSLREVERRHILAVLEHTNWNKSRAAEILGIERSTLDRKLKRYQVTRPPGAGRP